MSSHQIARLENELNCLKREKEEIDNQYQQRRQAILNLMSTTPPTIERAREMVNGMTEVNSDYRWKSSQINSKIQDKQMELLRQMQQHN
jgi:hypothetical protein